MHSRGTRGVPLENPPPGAAPEVRRRYRVDGAAELRRGRSAQSRQCAAWVRQMASTAKKRRSRPRRAAASHPRGNPKGTAVPFGAEGDSQGGNRDPPLERALLRTFLHEQKSAARGSAMHRGRIYAESYPGIPPEAYFLPAQKVGKDAFKGDSGRPP